MSYFLQANAFLIFFYGLYVLVLRRETFFRWNRGYLLFSVGLSLVIPLLKMPDFIQRRAQTIALPAPIERLIVPALPAPATPALPAPAEVSERQAWGLWEWLLVGYVGIVGLLLGRFGLSLGWLWWVGKGGVWQKDGRYYLAKSPDMKQNFSFFRTLFLGDLQGLDDAQIHQIVRHELAHIRQRHSWDIVFLELVVIVFWINPVGLFYKKSIRKIHEYLADKEVLAYQDNKNEYANLILTQTKKK